MYSLLIVDDERSTRNGLAECIQWPRLGISMVRQAEDGLAALEKARLFKPDIVLCDIRMPRMNGLEFSDNVMRFLPNCKIIFMSGYSDEEYLRTAIRIQAVDYVNKPVVLNKIREAVGKAVFFLEAERFNETIMLNRNEEAENVVKNLSAVLRYAGTNAKTAKYLYSVLLRKLGKPFENEIEVISDTDDRVIVRREGGEWIDRLEKIALEKTQTFFLESAMPGVSNKIVAGIIRFINSNLSDVNLSLQTIGEHSLLTPTYICSIFKAETKKTIKRYITDARMEKAKVLLLDKRSGTQTVAKKVGYSDPKYFAKLFKKHAGMSPSEFRKSGVL